MTEPLVTFPDVEQFIVDRFKDRSELAGVVVDIWPPAGFDGTQRAVLVSRVGGAWVDDLRIDQALVQLEVFGPDKAAAHAVALIARALVLQLQGSAYPGGIVTDVVEEDGPRGASKYAATSAPRYRSVSASAASSAAK